MDVLSSSVLSGLIYDGLKLGATISFDFLKSKLQGWLIDDEQIIQLVDKLKSAGIHEDLAPHAIERKINENESLLCFIQDIHKSKESINISQTSNVGHNIVSNSSGNITVGDIITDTSDK